MSFVKNRGQVADMNGSARPDILYSANAGTTTVFLRKGGISYVLTKQENPETGIRRQDNENEKNKITSSNRQIDKPSNLFLQRIDMEFVGSNPEAKVKAEYPSEGYTNYYLAHCPQGITDVSSYKKITYQDIYPNIDIVFYGGKKSGLKYDILIKPGGNPDDIKIKYSGADGIEIQNNELIIKNSIGEMAENMPKVYQNIDGKIVDIKANYRLNGTTLKFELSNFRANYPLIIDPFATWMTYYGGSNGDQGESIAADGNGNVYVTGVTTSNSTFPVLAGIQMAYGGGLFDAFVVKFNEAGGRQWATYYGGSSGDRADGIAADASGNVCITGTTFSGNFPFTSGGFQSVFGGGNDVFVVKLNTSGTPQWATYYGGTGNEYGKEITIDINGNVCITGLTTSNVFPVLLGCQMTNGGGSMQDAFVVKFNSSGVPQWATYYGGTGNESGQGITADAGGNVSISGYTTSTDFPFTLGCYQSVFGGGDSDAFVVKLNSSGILQWATYYGGTLADDAFGIATDAGGNIFFTGTTYSNDFPVWLGQQMSNGGGADTRDAFVVKFNSSGTRQWATYYGGNQAEEGYGIAIDGSGNSYITGDTYGNFPVTGTACQTTFGTKPSVEDQYLASLDPSGNLLCATYIGGNGHAEMSGAGTIALFGCYTYLTGSTPGSFPVTSGSYQTNHGGNADVFIAQLPKDCSCSITLPTLTSTPSATICNGVSLILTAGGAKSYIWSPSATLSAAIGAIVIANPSVTTTYTITGTGDCASATAFVNITVYPVPIANAESSVTISIGSSTTLSASGGGTYLWTPSTGLSCITCQYPVASPQQTTTYYLTVTNASGCTSMDSVIVTVVIKCSDLFVPTAFSPNGDGENDIFYIDGTCIKTFLLQIYDRWGEKVFETDNINKGWDGFFHGKQMDPGVFFLSVDVALTDETVFTGKKNLSLIR